MSTAPLRQEFEELIRRDLLGPAGGEQETITEQSVRNRYLLGMLAPLKVIEVDEEPFEELADGSEDNAEEGTAEPSTPAKRGVAPSTFGLSFCMDLAETAFKAEARWGQYLREPDADGKTVWKRYPRGGSSTISLQEGRIPEWSPDAESPHVVVRGRIRRRTDHWSVTLFLSNEQQEDRPRDMYWMFQAELAVHGLFTRSPSQGHVSTLDDISCLEDQTNEMLYRREVEFGRGHGIGIECELAEGCSDQAILVRTAAMPRAIVRTGEQSNVPGLITDMQELAEAADGDLAPKLRPLTEAYATWIAELEDAPRRRGGPARLFQRVRSGGGAGARSSSAAGGRHRAARIQYGCSRRVSIRQPRHVAAAREVSLDGGPQRSAYAPVGRGRHSEESQLARLPVGLHPD